MLTRLSLGIACSGASAMAGALRWGAWRWRGAPRGADWERPLAAVGTVRPHALLRASSTASCAPDQETCVIRSTGRNNNQGDLEATFNRGRSRMWRCKRYGNYSCSSEQAISAARRTVKAPALLLSEAHERLLVNIFFGHACVTV